MKARVVSMPSWEVFEHQPAEYRASVLPPDITARVAVEQASTFGWASLHRTDRPDHRHAHLRRLGPAQGAAQRVQLHGRRRRRGGEGTTAKREVSERERRGVLMMKAIILDRALIFIDKTRHRSGSRSSTPAWSRRLGGFRSAQSERQRSALSSAFMIDRNSGRDWSAFK